MKALVLRQFGSPLVLEETPVPPFGPEDALIRVRACAVDQFDLTIRDGKFPTAQVPIILGHEIAGEVEQVGARHERRAGGPGGGGAGVDTVP